HVVSFSAGVILRPLVCPFIHLRPMPERARRNRIAARYKRRFQGVRKASKSRARCSHRVAVCKRGFFSETESPANQTCVECVEFTLKLAACGLLVGPLAT